jgi:Relaxase/Mobilisation nuclease domain
VIIKGNPRRAVAFWSRHLTNGEVNERASITDIHGLGGLTVRDCLGELQAIAEGTRTENGFYVASLNPYEDERLTPEQWDKVGEIFRRKMGFENQPYFIVEHEKDGRTHRHIVVGRIDADTMKPIPNDYNYQKHEEASREIEETLGLRHVDSVLVKDRGTERPERRPKDWEGFRAGQSKIDPQVMKAEITALYQAADSGQSFKAAVEEAGYLLAKGDRRDFVLIDKAADDHSLGRRIEGAKAKEIRERLSDIDRDSLPSVAEAREQMRAAHVSSGGGAAPPQAASEVNEGAVRRATSPDKAEAIAREEARQTGPHPELTPDTERGLAARFGDWTPAPQGAAAGSQPAPQGVAATSPPEPQGPGGDWQEAGPGRSADQREQFTFWERMAGRVRGYAERMRAFWHDETSGMSEETRERLGKLAVIGLRAGLRRLTGRAGVFKDAFEEAAPILHELADSWLHRLGYGEPEPEAMHPEPPGEPSRDAAEVEGANRTGQPQQGPAAAATQADDRPRATEAGEGLTSQEDSGHAAPWGDAVEAEIARGLAADFEDSGEALPSTLDEAAAGLGGHPPTAPPDAAADEPEPPAPDKGGPDL